MATSPVEIANSALARVGSDRITSLEDDTTPARRINEQYDNIRKSILRSHPWNFAKKRVQLGLLVEVPLFDFDYYYELPSDCLRVLAIDDPDAPWIIEGRKLATDANPVEMLYIYDVTDTQQFDPHFDEAFATAIAANVAYAFTQSVSLRKELMDEAKLMLATARSFNAQEGTPVTVVADTFWRVRF